MKSLRISDALSLPLDDGPAGPGAIVQKNAVLGRTGSGKTYAATKLAELMLEAGAQIIALDPVGIWPFLRLGDRPFDLPVLGGLYGDVPLEATGGSLVADFVVDTGSSAVLDVSQFTDSEARRFATAFGDRLFQRKKAAPSPVHLFLEECQEFVPQESRGDVARMLHVFERLVKLGRNFKIGVTLISQRPQEVNKKALNQTECLYAFQMTGPQERKAIAAWTKDKGLDVDIDAILPKLAVGHCHVWSPQWLGVSKQIGIAKKRTLDAAYAPAAKSGTGRVQLSPVNLPKLREAMAETVERAKAEDPAALRERIRELERELEKKPTGAPEIREVRVEVPMFDKDAFNELKREVVGQMTLTRGNLEGLLHTYMSKCMQTNGATAGLGGRPRPAPLPASVQPRPPVTLREKAAVSRQLNGTGGLSKAERQILTALAQHGSLSLTQAAIITGYSPKSGGMRNAAGALRTRGYVLGGNEKLDATSLGVAALGNSWESLPTGRQLAEHWYGQLGKAERDILAIVVDSYPDPVALSDAAERCGYSAGSGGVRNAAGKLRTLDLIVGGNSGMVANERLVR